MTFLPVALDAMLVELDDLPRTLALLRSLQADPIAGIEEVVPAARTLLVRFRPAALPEVELRRRLGARSLTASATAAGTRIEIPVDYRGEDLDEVAALLGISREEVVRRHTGSDYLVAFTGFAPGFAYLSGGDPSLDMPRRATPRTRIPAGAVGLAGRFSGVYPQASPGGWQIIGTTTTPMWDLRREVPALLQPGFRVRFVDASAREAAPLPEASARIRSRPVAVTDRDGGEPLRAAVAGAGTDGHGGATLEVNAVGVQALFQDAGRPGLAGQGVSAAGAMDRAALRAANRLVGNVHVDRAAGGAAGVEIVDGGFAFTCRGEAVIAVTGAEAPIALVTADGLRATLPRHQAIALADGDRVSIAAPRAGLRSYLAVRGGFAVAPVLGSASTDTLSNLGPAPVAAGDVLRVRPVTTGQVVGAPEPAPDDLPTRDAPVVLDIVMGPRTDWFTPEAVALLAAQSWTVTPQSNRVGLRLAGGEALTRANPAELPSEGTVLGAIQVPPSGQPVLFLADHPLTGGYPVIGAVASHHLDRAGQIPIGAQVRFHPIRRFERHDLPEPRETP